MRAGELSMNSPARKGSTAVSFVNDRWGVAPAKLDAGSLPSLGMSPGRLFNALVKLRHLRQTDKAVRRATEYSGLGIDGTAVTKWDRDLPSEAGAGFDAYASSLLDKYRAADFFLLINNFQRVVPTLFNACCLELRKLLAVSELSERIEIARVASPVTMVIVVSNCLRSPTGIHMDPNHAFLRPVLGKKRIRFWHGPEIGKRNIGSQNIEPLKDKSLLIEAGKDSIIYWPSDWWHIADEVKVQTRVCLVLCVEARDGVRHS
jgi:hypothetical protein